MPSPREVAEGPVVRRLLLLAVVGTLVVPAASTARPQVGPGAARVRAALPAALAYYADHGTYVGMTLAKLRRYDRSIRNVAVRRATKKGFCIQSTLRAPVYHYDGPAGPLRTGPCGRRGAPVNPPAPPPPPPGDDATTAQRNLRGAVPAIEAYRAETGSYAGMTLEGLQRWDASVRAIEVAWATRDRYCIQSTVGAATYHYDGPDGPLAAGPCSSG
jgi:hypothetical protein